MISSLSEFLESSSRIDTVIINYLLCVCVCTTNSVGKILWAGRERTAFNELPERGFPLIIRQAYTSPTDPFQPNHQPKCSNHPLPTVASIAPFSPSRAFQLPSCCQDKLLSLICGLTVSNSTTRLICGAWPAAPPANRWGLWNFIFFGTFDLPIHSRWDNRWDGRWMTCWGGDLGKRNINCMVADTRVPLSKWPPTSLKFDKLL